MDILSYKDLPQGGFAGLRERQFVTDRRMFKQRKNPKAFDGIGHFVYLADANFMPHGETGLHEHREIDVISVMVEGQISHAGSLEHGQRLEAGMVQVQRAGAEGFKHNEINPNDTDNHMIQLWVMPDESGEPADYKVYKPTGGENVRVYGGPKSQTQTFYSRTCVVVANAKAGQSFSHHNEAMCYLSKGSGEMNGEKIEARTLVRSDKGLQFVADTDAQWILISLIS